MEKDIVLEIGVEELPHGFINPALNQLAELAKKKFGEQRIAFQALKTYGTPRRLTLHVSGVTEQQADLEVEFVGPATRAAYDENGNPTKAAQGFARSKGRTIDDIFIKKTDKGEYIAIQHKETGQPVNQLLPGLLQNMIESLTFPKTMRWGTHTIRFARPINWLVALFGPDVIPFTVDGIPTDRATIGHRFLSPGPFNITDTAHYFVTMEQTGVRIDFQARRQYIHEDLHRLASAHNAQLVENETLLDVVTNLVETPHAVICSFNPDYLVLPDQVIIISLEEHQKCFSLRAASGQLLPKFIQVSNASPANDDNVRLGSERVIRARLADALFFYEEDRKTKLEAKVEALKEVLFQKSLGTIYDKVLRVELITKFLSHRLALAPEVAANCQRAAHLAKADLVTHMIGEKEFTRLQGFMGWRYAAHDGELPSVARAIFEHYQPRFAEDELPTTIEGAVIACADKLDTVVGCYSVGIIPTGSQDPYALRRAALGITRIILARNLKLSISELISEALKLVADRLNRPPKDIMTDVLNFFRQRINNLMLDEGFDYDVIEAVLASSFDNFVDVKHRIAAIQVLRRDPDFEAIATANKRVSNILKKADSLPEVDAQRFAQDEERTVYNAYLGIKDQVNAHIKTDNYSEALKLLVTLREPIDRFFDKVLVMAEDGSVRTNRLAMLNELKHAFDRIADFSLIVVKS